MNTSWRYIDSTNNTVFRIIDGQMESCIVSVLPENTTILPFNADRVRNSITESILYKFPDGSISTSKEFSIDNINYPENIFYIWSLSELKNIGIKPYIITQPPYGYLPEGPTTETETENEWILTYTNPTPNLQPIKDECDNLIKSTRKSHEEDGFIFTDNDLKVFIATDLKGSLRISQLQMMFAENQSTTVEWQGADPVDHSIDLWFTMTYTRWISIVQAGMLFVQACFDKQKTLQDTLSNINDIPTLLDFKNTITLDWPS